MATKTHSARRVVLALPTGPVPALEMEAAAQVARMLGAALFGLFVEDTELLGAAALPITRQLDASRRVWAPLSVELLEAEFAAIAAALRRVLERSAARSGVASEFAVLRGKLSDAIAEHASEGDYVAVFGSVSRRPSDAPAGVAGVVYLPPDARPQRGPVVVVTGSRADNEVEIEVAAAIAARTRSEVVVVDALEEHHTALWTGAEHGAGAKLRPARGAVRGGAAAARVGLPPASLVVIAASTLRFLEERQPSYLLGRREPWLVLAT